MTPEPRLCSRSVGGGVWKALGDVAPKNWLKNGSEKKGEETLPPGVRMILDEDTFTTAGTARLTTDAKPSSKEILEAAAETGVAIRMGIVLPVLAVAQEPANVPTPAATSKAIAAVETAI